MLRRLRALCDASGADDTPRGDDRVAKVFHIVRTLGDERDVFLSADRVIVRVIGDPRLHAYSVSAAAHTLRQILHDARIRKLDRPIVARAFAGSTWEGIRGRSVDAVVWLIPRERGVEVRFRVPGAAGMPPAPMDIPAEGPWALPAEWVMPAQVVVYVDRPTTNCPHCHAGATRFRSLATDLVVCPQCGRSFHIDVG